MKTDRERDGWVGPVQSIRCECSDYLERKDDSIMGPRQLNFIFTYDVNGNRIGNNYGPKVLKLPETPGVNDLSKYDASGNLVEHSRYSDGVLQWKLVFSYDDRANKLEEVMTAPDGSVLRRTLYKYDEHRKAIEMSTYNPDGSLDCKHTYVNKFDVAGNMVEQTVRRWTNINGEMLYEPLFITYYTITYY